MPPGIGYSFQPGAQDTQFQDRGQGGQGVAPQQAIRTLSLRVPQQSGPQGIAPLPLLNAQGGGGNDLDMLLMALLKAFGQGGAMQGQGFSGRRPQGAQASPRIIPGLGDPTPPQDFPGGGMPQPIPPPQIPRDFQPRGPLEGPAGGGLDLGGRAPGGGLMGGVLRGRDPNDVFPGGVQPLF